MKHLKFTYSAAVPGEFFTAHQNYQQDPHAIYLEDLTGWDDDATLVLRTEPKLSGVGSYLVSSSVEERTLQVTINVKPTSQAALNAFRAKLINSMHAVSTCILERTYTQQGSPTQVETLRGHVSSISKWDQLDDICSIRFSVLCVDPLIT